MNLIEAAERVCSTESRKTPATTWLRRKEVVEVGAPDQIRTDDPLVRSQVLYPTELRALFGPPMVA